MWASDQRDTDGGHNPTRSAERRIHMCKPNILEYIEELMDGGMSEEDASKCANVMFNDDGWEDDED